MLRVIILALFATALADSSYDIIQDIQGQQYYVVPVEHLHRQRRQAIWGLSGPGIQGTLGYTGTLLNQNGHRLDASALATKQLKFSGPVTAGGQLNYQHVPSGSNVNIQAQHTPRAGTDLSASGVANLWRSNQGNARLDAVGNYNRHYGGLWGTSKPDYFGGLQFKKNF